MRRFCGVLFAVLVLATIAVPAGAQEAPDAATGGLCTAHFFGIPAESSAPGVHIAHETVPLPTGTC
jgi:hypothetical protein